MFESGYVLLDLYLFLILIIKLMNLFMTLFQNILLKSELFDELTLLNIINNLNNTIIILMSILLIILFKPFGNEINLTKHMKMFLFTFGILQILQFINEKK